MTSRFTELAIDCADPDRLAAFWCAVLGYDVTHTDDETVTIGSAEGGGPVLTFARVPERKTIKNRVHPDVRPADRGQAAEVERILALGATRADVGQGERSWVVLVDPEGNEFCVLAADAGATGSPAVS